MVIYLQFQITKEEELLKLTLFMRMEDIFNLRWEEIQVCGIT